jgi:hypothetical protein
VTEKTRKREPGFSYLYPDLEPEDQRKKDELLREKVRPLLPSKTESVADLVHAMAGMSIQARNLGECYRVMQQIYSDAERPTVLLGLAGPLVAGGLRQVIREFIANGLVDVLVSTGAILYQDLYQARGYQHFRGTPDADDAELRSLLIDRIYDTYVDEQAFGETDTWVGWWRPIEPRASSAGSSWKSWPTSRRPRLDRRTCREAGVDVRPLLSELDQDRADRAPPPRPHKEPAVQIDSIQDN